MLVDQLVVEKHLLPKLQHLIAHRLQHAFRQIWDIWILAVATGFGDAQHGGGSIAYDDAKFTQQAADRIRHLRLLQNKEAANAM